MVVVVVVVLVVLVVVFRCCCCCFGVAAVACFRRRQKLRQHLFDVDRDVSAAVFHFVVCSANCRGVGGLGDDGWGVGQSQEGAGPAIGVSTTLHRPAPRLLSLPGRCNEGVFVQPAVCPGNGDWETPGQRLQCMGSGPYRYVQCAGSSWRVAL